MALKLTAPLIRRNILLRSGFTLVEVIVVSALILLVSLLGFQTADVVSQREKEDRLRSSLLEMRLAMDQYHQDHLKFPDSIQQLIDTPRVFKSTTYGRYLRRFPLNPLDANFPPARRWEVSGKTSLAGTTDVWTEITDPAATIGMPIVDIRCPPDAGTGLNGIPYQSW